MSSSTVEFSSSIIAGSTAMLPSSSNCVNALVILPKLPDWRCVMYCWSFFEILSVAISCCYFVCCENEKCIRRWRFYFLRISRYTILCMSKPLQGCRHRQYFLRFHRLRGLNQSPNRLILL